MGDNAGGGTASRAVERSVGLTLLYRRRTPCVPWILRQAHRLAGQRIPGALCQPLARVDPVGVPVATTSAASRSEDNRYRQLLDLLFGAPTQAQGGDHK